MEIEKILITLGLTEKEAQIYLVLLQVGQDSVFNIAKKSELKRPTVYLILDSLLQKGLASILKTPKAILYSATSPKKLEYQVEEQKNNLEKILPTLETIYNLEPNKPKIQIFQGANGLKTIITEIIETLKPNQEIICYGNIDYLYHPGSVYKEIADLWISKSTNKLYKIREIINTSEHSKIYSTNISKMKNQNHQIRFAPNNLNFECDNVIYGNKLAIFSTQKDLFVVVIESEPIVNSYRQVFEALWQISSPEK